MECAGRAAAFCYSRRVPRHGLRQKAGALLYDAPRFVSSIASPKRWVEFRNRDERLTIDPKTGGAHCEWMFTSDLHLCSVYPITGRWLLSRATAQWPIRFDEQRLLSGPPRVSFIIGHRGASRVPLLLRTIASIGAQRGARIECIVVEQSAQPLIRAQLPEWVRYVHTPIASDDEPYNRSHAFNAGAIEARAPLLVLHDNDFLVPAHYAAQLAQRHDEGHEFIDLKRFMFYVSREDIGEVERVVQNSPGGGSVAVDRKAYDEIGRFDESFVGWGGEDNEFWERAMTRRVYAFGYLPFIHLWHPSQMEKASAQAGGGAARFRELAAIPPEERIARLRKG
jgi:hypothetical protein